VSSPARRDTAGRGVGAPLPANRAASGRTGPGAARLPTTNPGPGARVLHVITHLDAGGAQDNTLLTVAGLDRDRWEVDLLAGPGACEARAREVADRLIVLPRLRRALVSPADVGVALTLLRIVGAYDVVHTHGSKAGVLGRLAARARGVPAVVHTIHGFPVHDHMPRWQWRVLLTLERLAARCADRIVCVCEANAAEALVLGVARSDQLRVVASGVPTEVVLSGSGDRVRRGLGIPADAPLLVTITRLMEQKAPLDFVAAARRVLAAIPTAHVLMAGDGPLRERVATAAAGEPRLHLLGLRSDVPDLLAAADVVAFSSLWEGLGRALTEAVLAGRPVVATAVNGVPDLVVDGATGHLTPPGRPDVLADRVVEVLARPDRGAAMGAAGAARIAGRFDVAEMVQGLDRLYTEALAERAPDPAGSRS
jgi:glycosyltransferase involved in cell wall biosynthesis